MKHIRSIVGAALALTFLAVAVFAYGYMVVTIQSFRDQALTASTQGNAAQAREDLARASSAFLAEIATERQAISASIATDAAFVSVIDTLEASGIREKVDVEIGSVSVVPSSFRFHDQVSVSLSAQGPFKNLLAFAASLETVPFASRVSSVSLQETSEGWHLVAKLEIPKHKP